MISQRVLSTSSTQAWKICSVEIHKSLYSAALVQKIEFSDSNMQNVFNMDF